MLYPYNLAKLNCFFLENINLFQSSDTRETGLFKSILKIGLNCITC